MQSKSRVDGRCSRGFTLSELVVVLGVLIVLASLILPAVFNSLEASRRTTCFSHLRQIGVAVASYEASYGSLPPAVTMSHTNEGGDLFGVLPRVLRYLEQERIADSINWSLALHEQPVIFHDLTISSVMRCPSDGNPSQEGVSFVFNSGAGGGVMNPSLVPESQLGAFDLNQGLPLSAFHDGLSNTMMFSERLFGEQKLGNYTDNTSRGDTRRGMAWIRGNPVPRNHPNELLQRCVDVPNSHNQWLNGIQRHWGYPWYYNALAVPNAAIYDCGYSPTFPVYGVITARSNHGGPVNVLFGDWRIETISGIELEVWRAFATRNGEANE